ELGRGDLGSTGAVDGVHEAEVDGVGEGDAEVDVPGAVGRGRGLSVGCRGGPHPWPLSQSDWERGTGRAGRLGRLTSGNACATGGAGFLGEFIEEGVFAVVGGPDGDVVVPGDAG